MIKVYFAQIFLSTANEDKFLSANWFWVQIILDLQLTSLIQGR